MLPLKSLCVLADNFFNEIVKISYKYERQYIYICIYNMCNTAVVTFMYNLYLRELYVEKIS